MTWYCILEANTYGWGDTQSKAWSGVCRYDNFKNEFYGSWIIAKILLIMGLLEQWWITIDFWDYYNEDEWILSVGLQVKLKEDIQLLLQKEGLFLVKPWRQYTPRRQYK